MKEYKKPNLTDDEFLQTLLNAKKYFDGKIFIATNNHTCGYDVLDYEFIETVKEFKEEVCGDGSLILNNDNYISYEEEGLTLLQILERNGWKFKFELSEIQW